MSPWSMWQPIRGRRRCAELVRSAFAGVNHLLTPIAEIDSLVHAIVGIRARMIELPGAFSTIRYPVKPM